MTGARHSPRLESHALADAHPHALLAPWASSPRVATPAHPRLDHAAYLGRELARAEESLRTGAPYVQDRAPEPPAVEAHAGCGCSGST